MLISLLFFSCMIFFVFIGLAVLLEKSLFFALEKQQYFECGFDSFFKTRTPFSLQFFVVGVVFVLFDLEIVIFMMVYVPTLEVYYYFLIFFFLLFLFYTWWVEWKLSNLKWFY